MDDSARPVLKARSCYGHLGGAMGSRLFERMLELGWIEPEGGKATVYRLTEPGERSLTELGVDIMKEGSHMQNQNPFAVFQQQAPQVAAAFDGLIDAISSLDGLDAKTRQLIYIGIKAAQGDTGAVAAHVPMAKSAGATREEIRDTVLLTLTVSGVKGVANCLVPALQSYENC